MAKLKARIEQWLIWLAVKLDSKSAKRSIGGGGGPV